MRQYATYHDKVYSSKPTIYDITYRVKYSEYMTYDVSHIRYYATCRSFSQGIGRVAGLYFFHRETEKQRIPLLRQEGEERTLVHSFIRTRVT